MEASNAGVELEQATVEAERMLSDLFSVMGIKRVIIVDDELSEPPDLDNIIGEIEARQSRREDVLVGGIVELNNIDFDSPGEIWKPALRLAWATLPAEVRTSIDNLLTSSAGGQADVHARGLLGRLLRDWQPQILSLAAWNAQRANLIATAVDEPTLLLFDQDMTGNGGAVDEGMKTIATLLKQEHANAAVYFGLFSNLVNPNAEHQTHSEFAAAYELQNERDRFAVISKQHLHQEPRGLAFRLKRVAISPICNSLKTRLFGAIENATADARAKIEQLDIYDFEQIVFQSSYREGVWEADTLLRLFGLYHREAARSRAKDDDQISAAADKVRSVIAVPYKPEDAPGTRASEVARLEMYESSEYLIAHRMPIEVGDIFQKTTGKKRYILIEQPCDLMVRGDNGRRGVDDVALAELFEHAEAKSVPESFVELPFLSLESGTKVYAKLVQCVTLPICILDLCVFSADGVASISIADPVPPAMIPAWQKRYEIVQKEAANIVERYRALAKTGGANGVAVSKEVDKVLQFTLTRSISGVVNGVIKLAPDRVEYGLKRVGRLKQPRAGSLLRDFAFHKARDAFDHPLTRTLATAANPLGG
jgi:hypothetical protein